MRRETGKKYGRFGEFVACGNYPKCKYVKQKTIGVKCPNCSEGEIIERRSKRGKTFYGCNRYPECDFVAWGKPIAEKCPDCGGGYLIEKFLKVGRVRAVPQWRVQVQEAAGRGRAGRGRGLMAAANRCPMWTTGSTRR